MFSQSPQAKISDEQTYLKHARLFSTGFTLIELLVTVSIIAIVALAASPAFIEWNANRKLMRQARTLFSHMQLAKLEAIKNNCDVVVSLNPPGNYQIFLDNGGPTATGVSGDEIQNGDEIIIADVDMDDQISMMVEAAQFSGTTLPGFTARGLPLQGRTGNVVYRRNGRTDRWYRVVLSPSGQMNIQVSSDSTNGVDGIWD